MCARTRSAGLIVAIALALVAAPAMAGWSSSVDAGALAITSATIAAPTAVAAANAACTPRQRTSLTVSVDWAASTSPEATGYTILRATRASGPFTAVGTVAGNGTTAWTDATGALRFTTTYYYVVEATVQSWTSPASSPAAGVTTPRSRTCA